jgi:hypothetical protein
MNSHTRFVLAGAACIAAVAVVRSQSPVPQAYSAPQAESQTMGSPPSRDYVWMAGHWNSEEGKWKWAAGHWDLPPNRSAVWVPGHWIQGSSGWVWTNGAWNVGEAPQSPDAPPAPPGQNPDQAVGQGVPMPSSPAPDVQGLYSPQGQAPVAYQGETAVDYPPIDYSVGYPGYYWNGAAWAWGFYPGPFSFGLGWGPRFGGWGRGYYHGGYGHGGHPGSFHGTGHVGGHRH